MHFRPIERQGKARLDGTSLDLLHQRVDVLCLERMSLGHHFEQDTACATFHSIGNGRRCQLHRRANEQTITIQTHSGKTADTERIRLRCPLRSKPWQWPA
jgi:hypothetical protein